MLDLPALQVVSGCKSFISFSFIQQHVLSESVIALKAGLRQLCLWLLQAEEPETTLSQASNSIAGSCAGGGTLATQQTSRGALNAAPSTFIIANCLCFQF
jgi:hypothetical protein